MDEHKNAVQHISTRLRDLYSRKQPYRIFHGSTNSTRQYTIDRAKMLDTSTLNHILEINTTTRTALVEPNVPMDELVAATLLHGLVPPVVMEFPGITVGGGYSGTSGESSSYRHGFFDDNVTWVEVVLPDGEVVRVSETERGDLFRVGGFGTVGVATLFELRLVEAKRFVEVVYRPFTSLRGTIDALREATGEEKNDYVDGIMVGRERGIVVTGRLTDRVAQGVKVQTFRGAKDPWFYLHADRITRKSSSSSDTFAVKEAVPLEDYLFRYDRGAFWTGAYAFKYFMVPFNRVTRWILDDFMKTRVMYHALHASGHTRQYIIQDLAIPADNVARFVEYIDSTLGFYPLWLCPLRPGKEKSLHPRAINNDSNSDGSSSSSSSGGRSGGNPTGADKPNQLINVGVWCPGPTDHDKFVALNRDLEHKVRELGGFKWLYAQSFYTEDEFWSIYDRRWYDGLRKKYHADHLPDVYEKMRVDLRPERGAGDASIQGWLKSRFWSIWPMTGLYGVFQTLVSKDYLLSK